VGQTEYLIELLAQLEFFHSFPKKDLLAVEIGCYKFFAKCVVVKLIAKVEC
jgi:hypothetical protein